MIDFPTLEQQVAEAATPASQLPPTARRLSELVRPEANDPDELLKFRFLARGGGMLLVGPTGVGKSSLSMQFMVLWALGREAFGIKPARALKSLLVQAENDDGDLAEMRDGVIRGLGLSPEDAKLACDNIVVVREDSRAGVAFAQGVLRPLLGEHEPDFLWIDPALAFLGGEASSQKDVGAFLRNLLNPLLHEFKCGCVVVHHTNKPPAGREKSDWQGSDFAYMGSGSIEWANWARGVIALRSVGSHSVFELRAAKRGARLRWKAADGETTSFAKLIAHGDEPGVIYWRDARPDEMPEDPKRKKVFTKEDVLPHVPLNAPIAKEALRFKANSAGIAINKVNGFVSELVTDGILFLWHIKRSGTNPQIQIARFPQPEKELVR